MFTPRCPVFLRGHEEITLMHNSGIRILLIEDNTCDAELIRAMLESVDEKCIFQRSDRISFGLKLLEKERFDAVLLDLGLPDSSGVNSLRKIQEKQRDLPVIVLTGLSDDELAAKAISLGAQDYLVKGKIDSDTLHRSILYSIQRKKAEETIRGLYEELKKMEEEVRHMAHHDPLTGLPNRRLFNSLLSLGFAQSRRHDTKLAVLFLDLDRFKDINDTLGHESGDQLLKEVAIRLKATVRASDTVARIGGDEFNIILPDVVRAEDISDVAQKIMESFRDTFMISGHEFNVTPSIGISIYPDDGHEMDALLKYADIAMYDAKKAGRNTYRFYNHEMNIRSTERIKLDSGLRLAIDRGDLYVHYQPIIDINTARIVCAEALVRWQHPDMGLLDAARFVSVAEETGFMSSIDEWVLTNVCSQVRTWKESGITPVPVTVNLSARLFQNPELASKVSHIIEETGIPPFCLHIEITESTAMTNIGRTAASIKELAEMGLNISIDNYGVGCSSLNYLKRLPVKRLKIDQSFIRDISTDSDDRDIINAVTAMAHKMDMKVVAEGVETEEQLSFLRRVGCDEMQGFLFSKPLTAGEFQKLIKPVLLES
jgi:diguanylate cyclase (GGDEF)-like protein